MIDPDFPESLSAFIQDCLPTLEAAELLLFLFHHPEKQWNPLEIVHEIRPTFITDLMARRYLSVFNTQGLVARKGNGRFAYGPTSAELEAVVRELAKAYKERPVTLIRAIYSLRENKIQSFADAFKIKKG